MIKFCRQCRQNLKNEVLDLKTSLKIILYYKSVIIVVRDGDNDNPSNHSKISISPQHKKSNKYKQKQQPT